MLVPLIDHAALGYDAALPADLISTATKLGLVGQVQVQLPPQTRTEGGLARLKPLLRAAIARVGPFKASEADTAVLFLDQGALTVYFDIDVSTPRAAEVVLDAIHGIPPQRVAALLQEHAAPFSIADEHVPATLLDAINAVKNVVGTVIVSVSTAELHSDFLRNLRAAVGPHIALAIQCSASSVKHAEAARLHRHDMQFVYPTVIAMSKEDAEAAESRGHLDLGSTLAACARSDRADRLFATVVNDECGRTLGLVYSSAESIIEAIRCGRGVYFSRSRGGLWRKGDTSGAWQALRAVRLDCDSDALLFTVKQMGTVPAFCHLNTRNCWGEDAGLGALERTLVARKLDAPVGSYTKRLFDDHELLRHKLLEEAQELAEARDPDHVAAEAADLFYFALVACAKAGVGIADIEAHLDRRALKIRRRPGDSKPARIAAAQAHFEAVAAAGGSATHSPHS